MVKVLVRGILLFLVVVCTAAPRASDPMRPPLEITLRMGQAVRCGRGIVIRFQDVLQDSRCPEGATCISAGNARVALSVRRTWKRPLRIELNTNLEPRIARISNYTVELVRLSPTRRVQENLDKRAYVVTLRVKSEHS
jgi:hypothetical protein